MHLWHVLQKRSKKKVTRRSINHTPQFAPSAIIYKEKKKIVLIIFIRDGALPAAGVVRCDFQAKGNLSGRALVSRLRPWAHTCIFDLINMRLCDKRQFMT